MQIRQDLIFTGANRPSFATIEIPDGEDPIKVSLSVKAPLNRGLAELLGVEYLIVGEDTPANSFKSHDMDLVFHDLTLRISCGGDCREIFPETVYAMRAYRAGEATVKIQFKADYSGSVDELYGLLNLLLEHRGEELYEVRLSPRQKEMFNDVTQVDMTGVPPPPDLPLFLEELRHEDEFLAGVEEAIHLAQLKQHNDDPPVEQTLASVVDIVDPEKRKRGRPRKVPSE